MIGERKLLELTLLIKSVIKAETKEMKWLSQNIIFSLPDPLPDPGPSSGYLLVKA